MDECIFCKIVRGEVSSHKFWEDNKHIAFLSIYPNTKGFSVVATKNHYPSYAFENSDEALSGIVLATKKAAKILDATFDDVGRCGMFFEGFGVDHLHSKLFPMHGTADKKQWERLKSNVDKYFEKYEGYLSSHDSKRADDRQLASLAQKLKKTAEELGL